MAAQGALAGLNILVVEDDFFIADDIRRTLIRAGAKPVGPFSRADEARVALQDGATIISAALLDVNLAGEVVYPLAEELQRLGIPFIFATGYDPGRIPGRFDTVPKLIKPIDPRMLVNSLVAQMML